MIDQGNRLTVVEMRGKLSKILFDTQVSREIPNLTDIIKFNAFEDKSQDTLISESIKFAFEQVILGTDDRSEKMVIVVTDGMFNKQTVKKELNKLSDSGVESVCLLLDADDRLQKVKSAIKDKNGNIKMVRYFDDFPFKHFCVLNETDNVPAILSKIVSSYLKFKEL